MINKSLVCALFGFSTLFFIFSGILLVESQEINNNKSYISSITNNNSDSLISNEVNLENKNNNSLIAHAGMDIDVPENVTVILNGSSSFSPSGNLSYQWRLIDSDDEDPDPLLPIRNSSILKFQSPILNSEIGSYGFELVISDKNGSQSSDFVVVTVNKSSTTIEKNMTFTNLP